MSDGADSEAGRTVLIAEDQDGLAELYADILGASYESRIAKDGEEALAQMNAEVDIVLLDRQMPKVHGDDVLAEFRARDFDQPVAMISAVYPEPEIVAIDIDEYLLKPVRSAQLREVVRALAARTECSKALREYLALTSIKTVLEANMDTQALTSSDNYQRLQQQLADLRETEDVATADLTASGPAVGFREYK